MIPYDVAMSNQALKGTILSSSSRWRIWIWKRKINFNMPPRMPGITQKIVLFRKQGEKEFGRLLKNLMLMLGGGTSLKLLLQPTMFYAELKFHKAELLFSISRPLTKKF
jgi:hypothetical protein